MHEEGNSIGRMDVDNWERSPLAPRVPKAGSPKVADSSTVMIKVDQDNTQDMVYTLNLPSHGRR